MNELNITVRIRINLKNKAENIGEDVQKLEPLCNAGRNVKWYSCCGRQYGDSSKN